MNAKLLIFMITSSILVSILTPSSNFISAVTPDVTKYNCNSTNTLCAVWFSDGSTMLCNYNASTKEWDCSFITEPPKTGSGMPSELRDAIDESMNVIGPSNSNDPKDLGEMKTDKGTTMSPTK